MSVPKISLDVVTNGPDDSAGSNFNRSNKNGINAPTIPAINIAKIIDSEQTSAK